MFDRILFIVREAFVALRRNVAMAFAGITTGAIALFLLGLLAFAYQAANDYTKTIPNMFDMRVFLNDGVAREEVNKTVRQIREFPGVGQVVLLPKEREWQKMQADHPELTKGLENPLPDQLKVVVSDLPKGDAIAERIQSLPTVVADDGVHYLRSEQRMVIAGINAFKVLGLALFILLLLSTGVLIYNTIRLTVLSRRLEIRIMQLVGASPATIRVPFLIEGTVQGVVAGVLAGLLLLATSKLLGSQLNVNLQLGTMPVGQAMAVMILTGGGYGFLCSVMAVRVPLQYR
jgi:cell division transport system permease protein